MRSARWIVVAAALCVASAASAQPLPHRAVAVEGGHFTLAEPAKNVGDISGIACESGGRADNWNCLVIDDELDGVQRARLAGGAIFPGAAVALAAPTPETTFGSPPTVSDPRRRDDHVRCSARTPREFDREAISFSGGYYYLVGSHGCSRNSNKFDQLGFMVARFRLDANGAAVDMQYSYRLSEALRAAPDVGRFFGRRLRQIEDDGALVRERGLNIEGAVVSGGVLYAGLRAPSLEGRAFVVGVRVDELFSSAAMSAPVVRRMELGDEVGIRDLAVLPGGDFLILGGPTETQEYVRYGLYRVNAEGRARRLGRLAEERYTEDGARARAKAEALFVLSSSERRLRVLVMYDGPPDGAPRIVDIRGD